MGSDNRPATTARQETREELIARKLAERAAKPVAKKPTAKKVAPAKKAAGKERGRVAAEMPQGVPVGDAAISGVCRTSGCKEQGQRKTVRIPRLGSVVLLPGGMWCVGCARQMHVGDDDVWVERIER